MQGDNKDDFETFDGELLHPSLDIKNDILVLGFRYCSKALKEEVMFVMTSEGNIQLTNAESFTVADKLYVLDKRRRKLARIEEKWSIAELKKFVDDYKNLKPLTTTPREVFEEIVVLAKRYIALEQEIDYYLLAGWIIGTYFYPIFYAYPFLHIKAPKHSGKSQLLNFLTQLGFNAIKARPSLPALGDTVDSLRGTYLIDQADAITRKGNEELLEILADSYKKSGGKRRVIGLDKKNSREVLEFETYSPKVFASIKELPEDLRDRCLVISLVRSQRNFLDPDESNENWREIRGGIYKTLMMNYELISSSYAVTKIKYRENPKLIGRTLELWLPFEVIFGCFGMQEKIEDAKKRFLSQYGFSEYEPTELEEAVIVAILNQFQDKTEVTLTPKGISEMIDSGNFPLRDSSPKQRAAQVGWAIKKFNLSSEKKPRTKDGFSYLFEKNRVEAIYNSYFKNGIEPTPPTLTDFNGLNSE